MKRQDKDNFLGKKPGNGQEGQDGQKPSFLLMYIAIGCFGVGAILFALSFLIRGAGVYLLIASMMSELASVSFLNGQKLKGENVLCKVMRVLSYIVMAAGLIVFVLGASVIRD